LLSLMLQTFLTISMVTTVYDITEILS
jgi:hypothetical protein